jgi:uncharacterized protein YegP (UPF0339 family)
LKQVYNNSIIFIFHRKNFAREDQNLAIIRLLIYYIYNKASVYNLFQEEVHMPAIFEVYKDKQGEYRFRLKSVNGEVIASSEGYASKQNCLIGIDSVKINAATAVVVELIPEKDLQKACDLGDLAGVKKALGQGANPNTTATGGGPLLIQAVNTGNLEIIKELVQYKAQVNQTDVHGSTPLHEASDKGRELIVQFLIKSGAKIDARDNKGNTPLFKALLKNNIAAVQVLVGAGAKPNVPNNDGVTPAHIAAEKGISVAIQGAAPKNTLKKIAKKPAKKSAKKAFKKKR